jgi:Trk K+ transport system NAD-binding subunit
VLLCEAALKAGHKLTLYVRNPSKFPEGVASNENVNIIEGDLTQEDRLQEAAACGASVLVSFLGPGSGHKGTVSYPHAETLSSAVQF